MLRPVRTSEVHQFLWKTETFFCSELASPHLQSLSSGTRKLHSASNSFTGNWSCNIWLNEPPLCSWNKHTQSQCLSLFCLKLHRKNKHFYSQTLKLTIKPSAKGLDRLLRSKTLRHLTVSCWMQPFKSFVRRWIEYSEKCLGLCKIMKIRILRFHDLQLLLHGTPPCFYRSPQRTNSTRYHPTQVSNSSDQSGQVSFIQWRNVSVCCLFSLKLRDQSQPGCGWGPPIRGHIYDREFTLSLLSFRESKSSNSCSLRESESI